MKVLAGDTVLVDFEESEFQRLIYYLGYAEGAALRGDFVVERSPELAAEIHAFCEGLVRK